MDILDKISNTGLSGNIKLVPFFTDEPKFHNYFCEPSKRAFEKYNTEGTFGQGYDSSLVSAKIKCVGEMLERLCLINPPTNFLVSEYKENGEFIDPGLFFCYSSEQVENMEVSKNTLRNGSYKWVLSQDFLTGKQVYVPAQMVFLHGEFVDEYSIRKEQISTGTALGAIGTPRAFQSGFLEAIERDGIIGFYLRKVKGRKMKNFPKKINKLINYLERYNLEVHVFDATSDLGIPTIFAMTIDRSGIGDAVNVGSKADLTYYEAIKGSIMEAIQCRRLSRGNDVINPQPTPSDNELTSLEKRFDYWSDVKNISKVDYLISEPPRISYAGLRKKSISFEEAVSTVIRKGFNILVTDITLPEIRAQGFETLKVSIPELHPLYLNEDAKALYSLHYGEIPELNLPPHPIT